MKQVHADETPVKYMRIDKAKVKNGKKTYMWVYRNNPHCSPHPIVLYDWHPSRRADHPGEFLKNFVLMESDNGANASAMIFSIAEASKANNLNTYDYFEVLLSEIPKHQDDKNLVFINELLPWSKNV